MKIDAIESAMPRGTLLRCHLLESKLEFLRLLRTPAFALPTLVFPAMFYLLFGVVFARNDAGASLPLTTWMLATCSVFGVMAPGLFGFGVTVALDRERGWLELKRALPMPPGAYLGAKLVMAMLFAAIIFATIAVLAISLGGVRLRVSTWALLFLIEVLGVLPFCAIGLFIGSVTSGQGAPAVANLVYLPMSFLSGLWMPLALLPGVLGDIAPLWPAYHLAQLALAAVGQAPAAQAQPVIALAGTTLVFLGLARWRLARAG